MANMQPSVRTIVVILTVTAVEVAWAIFCGETQANLFLFYAGLIGASAVFFFPGVLQSNGRAGAMQKPTAETNR